MRRRKAIRVTTKEGTVAIKSLGFASHLGNALISLRKGNAIQGKVLNKFFTIDTDDIGEIKIRTDDLASVILKSPPYFPLDVLRPMDGTEISGVVTTTPVRVKTSTQTLSIPIDKILAIQF